MKRCVLLPLVAALVAGPFAGCETNSTPSKRRHVHHPHDSLRHMRMHRRAGGANLPGNSLTAETRVWTPAGPERADRIFVGSRLASPNGRSRTAIDPETWQHAVIEVTRIDDAGAPHYYHMELLRPAEWLASRGLREGASVPFAFEPLEIRGEGKVLGIFPCPEIVAGEGAIVTTTSVGFSQSLHDLHLADGEKVRATVRHRFFSRDRGAWISAGEISAGERLATHAGAVLIEAVTKVPTAHNAHSILCEDGASFYAGSGQLLTRGE